MSHIPRYRRPAFTLVELLVVIAIIGVLVALLLPAVQAAREAARRSQCSNNLKQLGIGMHNHHDTYNVFPKNSYGGVDYGWENWHRFSASYKVLPFIEQTNLYEQFDKSKGWDFHYNGPLNTKVKTFICPSSPPAPARSVVDWGGPGSNYGWCSGSSVIVVWGSTNEVNGMIANSDERKMAEVTDGLSNTIMAGEFLSGTGTKNTGSGKYPYDIFYTDDGSYNSIANKHFPTDGELNTIGSSAKGSPTGVRGNNGTMWGWYSHAQSAFNTAAPPNWRWPSAGGACCPGGAHDWGRGVIPSRSMHPAGVNAGFGDGSVRFIPNSVDLLTYQRLGNRNDGNVVQLD